jgi:hypothetical protein
VSGQVEKIRNIGHFDERVQPYSPRPCQEARKSIVGTRLIGEKYFPQ